VEIQALALGGGPHGQQLDRAVTGLRLTGLKLYPMYQHWAANDRDLAFPIYRAVAAYGSSLELFVGLLPCEWTYSEFGSRLAPVVRHPVVVDWLATFGGADHNDMNIKYKGVLDHLVEDAGPARRAELAEIFKTSLRYEWMFWEMAYTLERWPV